MTAQNDCGAIDLSRTPGHRSRGRAALPITLTRAPKGRAAAAGRCRPRRSRGTLRARRRRSQSLRRLLSPLAQRPV